MTKFAVFSGFLGSGKTTTMVALTKHHTAHHGRAAMIFNRECFGMGEQE